MDLTALVGNVALICTIACNFAGLQLCFKIFKLKSTYNTSALSFITGAACSSLWLQYGMFVQDSVLINVNLIAVVLQTSYILFYYWLTANKKVLNRQLFFTAAFLVSSITYVLFVADSQESATNMIGILACAGSLCTCAAPMVSVKTVFQTRNTETLPFLIIFSTFIVTSLWFFYGLLVGDTFLQVPNFIGALLAGFQLSLFVLFP